LLAAYPQPREAIMDHLCACSAATQMLHHARAARSTGRQHHSRRQLLTGTTFQIGGSSLT